LTLYNSLARHADSFVLWALCADQSTYGVISELGLSDLRPISLQEFEHNDEALLTVKQNRSQVEYYFTFTPSWLLYILNNFAGVDLITYLDADLFFFSSPVAIYEEMQDQSVLIVGHRFPEDLRTREKYGIYNVGLLAFRDDPYGRQCLHWWRERCLEWCYDRVENGRFADQKYLDDWPERFQQVVVLQHKGAGLGPWNVANYSLTLVDGKIMVDSEPLVFYHFHSFKQLTPWLYDPGLAAFGVHAPHVLKRHIYQPYVAGLHDSATHLSARIGHSDSHVGSIRRGGASERSRESTLRTVVRKSKHQLAVTRQLLQGDLWMVISGRIL